MENEHSERSANLLKPQLYPSWSTKTILKE